MNIKNIAILIAITCFFTSKAQDSISFDKLLSENQLVFKKPKDFTETEIIKNKDLFYNYAMKYDLGSFEVRYSIFPLSSQMENYKKSLDDPDPKTIVFDPNKSYMALFMANVFNVSGTGMENMPKNGILPKDAVKSEYGADAGVITAIFSANSEFAKGYKYCVMLILHKNDVADLNVSFLSNDNDHEKFKEYLLKVLHALEYK